MAEPTWGPRLEAMQAEAHAMLGQEAPLEAIADRMDDLGASWEDMLRVFLLGRWPDWRWGGWGVLEKWLTPRFPAWAKALLLSSAGQDAHELRRRMAERLPGSECGLIIPPAYLRDADVWRPAETTQARTRMLHAAESRSAYRVEEGDRVDGLLEEGGTVRRAGPAMIVPDRGPDGWRWLLLAGAPASHLEEDVRVEGAGDGLVLRLAVLDAWRPPEGGSLLFQEEGQPEGRLCLDSDFLSLASHRRIALAVGTEGRAVKAMPMPLFQMGSPVWAVGTGYLAPIPRREGEEPLGYVLSPPDGGGRARIRVSGWPGVQEPIEARIADCYR